MSSRNIRNTFLVLFFSLLLNVPIYSQSTGKAALAGKWLGELVVPGQVSLRMGIIITDNNDDSYKAALNIIDQSTGDIPIEDVYSKNDSVRFTLKRLGIIIEGTSDLNAGKLNCEFRQAGARFPLVLDRVDKLPELLRPQEPKAPFPYKVEEVSFVNPQDGITLSGTLTIPDGKGKFPAVVMITGSGKQNRDEEIVKHKPFWVIADHLSRNGIAVLRFDDRGVGKSKGNFDLATTGDFAEDALAAIDYLSTRKDVNRKEIGLVGHSEGGIAASVAAAGSGEVAFIVSLAGFARNFGDVALEQMLDQSRRQGRNSEDIELERAWRKKVYRIAGEKTDSATAASKLWEAWEGLSEDEIKRLNWPKGRQDAHIKQVLNPWWRYVLGLDNRAMLMQIKCPVLALYGEKDVQVKAADNIPFVEEALKAGGYNRYEIKNLPGLNHLFQKATTGLEYEYVRIDETISPAVLKLMSDWIFRTTK